MKQIESRREKAVDIVREIRSRNNISRQRNGSDRASTFKKIIQSRPNCICIV